MNLRWGVERMRALWRAHAGLEMEALIPVLLAEAETMRREDVEICREIGRHGASCINDGDTVLTHCNAGALATAGYGTALGVIRGALEAGKKVRVIADETRPFLQGARLTAWELQQDGIDVRVACDNACARTPDGAHIPIEERPDREVTHVGETRIVPEGVPVFNFAFDVTPADCITGIITEKGVLRAPYGPAIAAALKA